MTKSAIVNGTVRWLERNVLPLLVSGGVVKTGLVAVTKLARVSPDAAVNLIAVKYPFVKAMIDSLAAPGVDFEQAAEALKAAAKQEGGFVVQFNEVALFNPVPHSLRVTDVLIEELMGDIKSALTDERAVTAA